MAFLVVGLGNPGIEYEGTRHNAGFEAIKKLAEELRVSYWKDECGALCAHASYDGNDVILAMPQSFMNLSGGPVSKLVKKYAIDLSDVIIIHDELDLPPASIRVKFGGGLAGHNGLKSINEKLQTKDWARIRIGIGRPPGRMPVVDYVLAAPKGEQREAFFEGVSLAASAALSYMENGLVPTQDRFN